MVGGLPMMDPSWYLYAGIFVGPFVQEDAAVIAAATLSASDSQHFPLVFFVILLGLFISDIWKYWIGYSAHASSRARRWAEIFALIHSLGEIFGDEMNAILGIIACVAIFLTISVLGIGRWLSRRQTDQDASEDL